MILPKEKRQTRRKQLENTRALPAPRDVQRFRKELLNWFEKHEREFPWRKASTSKYEHIIVEFLLQRTRAETVATFYPKFVREFPSWKKLACASELQLQCYLQPIGLWRRRATSMQALAREMTKRRGRFPKYREEIEALPGVGQYVANAVLLFCHDQPEPLLDTNMARVLERVYKPRKLADIRYDPYLQSLARQVVHCKRPRDINWAILDLAALVCIGGTPRCESCPIAGFCSYNILESS